MRGRSQAGDPLWYKDAVIYELRVRSYYDSDADGIGDFRGLTSKLDYLQDLGVNTLWLLPFYPSPLRDDGYDISDYDSVHPDVGTLRDFKVFLKEAHRRDLRVVTELIVNHTSDQHAWFQKARRAKSGSPSRNFYVWSDTPERFKEVRVIFQDFESSNWAWDAEAQAYYWHRFYSHQPDLNYDSPRVRKAVMQFVDFWLGMGVDGLRLDAVPYLFVREGTNCENLPESHAFLKELRRHIDAEHPNRMLLAEANQWPEDAVEYFGEGDECHMAFHFPIMPRLFMSIQMEDRFPIVDILDQTPDIPESAQWAMFLRNHDELTLEMVTDEERDYMYQVYASDRSMRLNLGIRRRLAPLLGNDRKKIELMNALLFSLPGSPVIYYGDELGMGDNFYLGDRNGVRTPMQWNGDRNAGFSRANPQRLLLPVIIDPEYHYETVNVEAQQNNPHSLLWWMKRLIALRKQHRALGRGTLEVLKPKNNKVFVFTREWEDETILVLCNLSRFAQYVELDLSRYRGRVPVELFGRNEFPRIGNRPYLMTLGPHSFYWFSLEPRTTAMKVDTAKTDAIAVKNTWAEVLEGRGLKALESRIPGYLQGQRWFGGKSRPMKNVFIRDVLKVPKVSVFITIVRVDYQDGGGEDYLLPLAFAPVDELERWGAFGSEAVVSRLALETDGQTIDGAAYDAAHDPRFGSRLLEIIARRRRIKGAAGTIVSAPTRILRQKWEPGESTEATVLSVEQTNTSIVFQDRFILKLYRRLESGVSLDLEIGKFLSEHRTGASVPRVAGAMEYKTNDRSNGFQTTVAVLQEFIGNQGDAWRHTLDWLTRFSERVLTASDQAKLEIPALPSGGFDELKGHVIPESVLEWLGGYLESARVLGQRTAELHRGLASVADDPDFAAEPITGFYQRSLYQSARNLTGRNFRLLRDRIKKMPKGIKQEAGTLLSLESQLLRKFRLILDRKTGGRRIRIHGDFHLGQVLFTGKDFVIIDFEGEPARPLGERRIKRSPLRDVAGMLRSFDYAAYAALPGYGVNSVVRSEDLPVLEPWVRFWSAWSSSVFLGSYLGAMEGSKLLPPSSAGRDVLLKFLILEKLVYELGYELNNRPKWLRIPGQAIIQELKENE